MRQYFAPIAVAALTSIATRASAFGGYSPTSDDAPSYPSGTLCWYFSDGIPSFCSCTTAHAYGASMKCDFSMMGYSLADADFEFEPCDTHPHIHADITAGGQSLLAYDIGSGQGGSVPIPGASQYIPMVGTIGFQLQYKLDMENNAKGELTMNVDLGLDGCIPEVGCGADVTSYLPITVFNEEFDLANICGASGGGGGPSPPGPSPPPHDGTQCTTSSSSCTSDRNCQCPSGYAKAAQTFGNPAQECWNCQADGNGDDQGYSSNYDDDYGDDYGYNYDDGGRRMRKDVDATRVRAMATHKSLPVAPWSVPASTNVSITYTNAVNGGARGVEKDMGKAFGAFLVPWHVIKHAGWNEPANRYRSDHEFYINKFAPIDGAPVDMDTLRHFHRTYHKVASAPAAPMKKEA